MKVGRVIRIKTILGCMIEPRINSRVNRVVELSEVELTEYRSIAFLNKKDPSIKF